MEACIARQLEPNENIFIVIDGWMKKYNTSPNKFTVNNGGVAAIAVEWNQQAKPALETEKIVTALKKWAIENEKIIVVTTFSILVFTTSTMILNSPIISLKNLETGISTFLFDGRTNTQNEEAQTELTTGVYYVDENNRVINEKEETNALFSEAEIDVNGETSIPSFDKNLVENAAIRGSINQMIDDFMQEKVKNARMQSEEDSIQRDVEVETFSMEDPAIASESIIEIPTVIIEGNGTEIIIPSSVRQTGLCPNNTPYSYFYGRWNRGTGQREISEQWGEAGMPSSNGIATLNDRYLVAVSPIFGRVGDYIDIVLSDGQIIPAIIADAKGADATSQWGHVLTASGAVDIIEWEASGTRSEIDLGTWRNVTVAKIINYGKEIVPVETPIAEVVEEVEETHPEEQEYIELYSNIYGLNEEQVYQIISDMTDGFDSELYQQYNTIEKTNIGGKTVACNSKEMAILLCIRNIYYNPGQYGVTSSEIKVGNSYRSDLSYAKQIEYLSNVLGVDASLNYAICQAACNFNSPMFLSKNNPTNIMINDSYATFPTATAGLLEQTIELLEGQLEGKTPIEAVGLRMSSSLNNTSINWNSNVLEVYNYVSKNYASIFGSTDEIILLNVKTYSLS